MTSFTRWLPTFLGFPLGGLLAIETVGAVTGAAVGAAQSALLGRARLAWTAATSVAWALGWLATYETIVDIERGYAVFGAGGALVATVLTGLTLRLAVRA